MGVEDVSKIAEQEISASVLYIKTTVGHRYEQKWPWDGSEFQLRTVLTQWSRNEELMNRRLGESAEMARNKKIEVSVSATQLVPPWSPVARRLWRTCWPLWLRTFTAPMAAATSPQLSTAEEPVVIVGMGPQLPTPQRSWVLSPWS